MAKLILHVGTHKTATTTIQKSFFANRTRLAKHGLIYPDIGRTDGHHGLVTDWVNLAPVFHLAEGSAAAWHKLVRSYANKPGTVFLSSEEFSRGHPRARIDFAQVREWLTPFEEIEVICVLRDQVSFLQSIYLELSKKTAPPYWGSFFEKTLKTGFGAGLFMNYCDLDDHLQSGFAGHEIRYVNFSDLRKGGGVLAHMLALAGCPLSSDALHTTPAEDTANVSPDPLSAWVASMIARPKAAPQALLNQARAVLETERPDGAPTTLYVRSEIDKLMRLIDPWNETFHTRLAKRQPDFRLDMPTLPHDIMFRNDLKTPFWVKLAQGLYRG